MGDKNPKVDQYLSTVNNWRNELSLLREVVRDSELTEELKWGAPCYTYQTKNIAILGGFKEYFSIGFFKGALMKDPKGILLKQGANSRSARIIRFTSGDEIGENKTAIKAYIREAIEIEKSGLKVDLPEADILDGPEEFQAKLEEDAAFRTAFGSLTPGRQRGYLLHFAGAKQAKSRIARIEKCMPRIFAGKGLHDCTCGLSKKMPTCDGSHKQFK